MMKLPINKILNCDALTILKTLPSNLINSVISSPPYWALRDYGVEGQLGLEPTFGEYITKLCDIFDEVKRVLRKDGTCFVNLGDTYGGTGQKNDFIAPKYKKGLDNSFLRPNGKILEKSLCLIPMQFAIEMVNRGWILRNDIVWYKRNSMPSSVNDRFTNKWEHLFFFVKSKKYYFDLDSVRKPHKQSSINRINAEFSDHSSFNYRVREACKGTLHAKFGEMYKATPQEIESYGSPRVRTYHSKFLNQQLANKKELRNLGVPHDEANCNPIGGNPGDVVFIDEDCDFWDITTKPHSFAHFACYPEELVEKPLKCGCPKDGIVLDPFIGSGTTALVALKQNKKFIGIELNQGYIEIAKERLKPYLEQTKLFEDFVKNPPEKQDGTL
jgi:DNA modification methylase